MKLFFLTLLCNALMFWKHLGAAVKLWFSIWLVIAWVIFEILLTSYRPLWGVMTMLISTFIVTFLWALWSDAQENRTK